MKATMMFVTLFLLSFIGTGAFNPSSTILGAHRLRIVVAADMAARASPLSATTTRRSFFDGLAITSSIAVSTLHPALIEKATASGGATAGGAYLLSAKQRYNDRVQAGVKGFVAIAPSLEGGNVDDVRAFFTSEDVGSWKDLTTAGYLLANAFRRNSTAPPDSIPAVKKWKAFAGKVELMTKSLKKKDIKGAFSVYKDALVALDEYLNIVELPSYKEITSA